MLAIAAMVVSVLIYAAIHRRQWHSRYEFYVTEMMFMTHDSYRVPRRDKLRAAWRALRADNRI